MSPMDKLVSYKRYASNLIVANIVITCVWIVLSLSIIKALEEEDDDPFLIWSLLVICAADVVSAYFGITGVFRRESFQLTTFYIVSQIAIASECVVCLVILLTCKSSLDLPIITTVQSGVAISVLISQIWLLFETKNFQNLAESLDFGGFDDFKSRRISSPPNLSDIERNSHIYALTDQLLATPVVNDIHSNGYNCFTASSRSLSSGSVYQPSTVPYDTNKDFSQSNQWYSTSRQTLPECNENSFAKY